MVDELIAQLFNAYQRLIAFGQRTFDIHACGHVDEGEKGRAIGQRRGGAIEHRPVAARETAFEPNPLIRQSGDGGAQGTPGLYVGEQRSAKQGYAVDMW